MAGRQAKIIAPAQLRALVRHVQKLPNPLRSEAIVLLSVKAGMRAGEIAKLEWPMVLNAAGKIADTIEIRDCIAKKRSGRRLPMHPDVRRVLRDLYRRSDGKG